MSEAKLSRLLLGAVGTCMWMMFSSALIFLNKALYKEHDFQKPCFVTGMGQLFSFFGGLCLVQAGVLPLRPMKVLKPRSVVTTVRLRCTSSQHPADHQVPDGESAADSPQQRLHHVLWEFGLPIPLGVVYSGWWTTELVISCYF